MLPVHIALVSWTRRTDPRDLSHVAAALQKQAIRDLAPIWRVAATVDVFPTLRAVPAGYWPVVIVDDVKGAAGYHQDSHGHPYALVEYSRSWSLTASHEVLEMLCDPWGRRVVAGRSPKLDQGQVEFLVEACDPCESSAYAYTINGVLVSDFITPYYYDPRRTVGARYSFTGAVTRPRHILAGGYVSWWDPQTNHVWQQVWFGPEREFVDLGEGGFASGMSLREFVDVNSQHPGIDTGLDEGDGMLADARDAWHGANATADARGARLEEELARWAAG
ncbi:MAG TPA: hypothetical protein VK278_05525 [Gaiellaceae bacterium]|nr:hypothetical protein [Gaiellaceae bacterium]